MIFHRPIRPTVEHVEQYKISTLALHNYLLLSNNAIYTPSGLVDSESGDRSKYTSRGWCNKDIAQGFNNIRPIYGNRNCVEVVQMCNEIKEHLNSEEGSLPWPQDYIR